MILSFASSCCFDYQFFCFLPFQSCHALDIHHSIVPSNCYWTPPWHRCFQNSLLDLDWSFYEECCWLYGQGCSLQRDSWVVRKTRFYHGLCSFQFHFDPVCHWDLIFRRSPSILILLVRSHSIQEDCSYHHFQNHQGLQHFADLLHYFPQFLPLM